jgi:hypothetical protein
MKNGSALVISPLRQRMTSELNRSENEALEIYDLRRFAIAAPL